MTNTNSAKALFERIGPGQNTNDFAVSRLRSAIDLLPERPGYKPQVLDIAIGNGRLWKRSGKANLLNITGVDLSRSSIKSCGMKKLTHRLICIDANDNQSEWPQELIPDESFDFVLCYYALSYMRNAALVVQRMIDKATKGGILSFEFQSKSGITEPEIIDYEEQGLSCPVYLFPFEEIMDVIRRAGLEILDQTTQDVSKFNGPGADLNFLHLRKT